MPTDERITRNGWRPHGAGSLLAALVLAPALALVLSPAVAGAQGAPVDTVMLGWTSPGDDGMIGTAAVYQLRISQSPINESNWSGATLVLGAPVPQPAGTYQTMVARGLTYGTTYYFAIKTADEAGNWSPISNLVRWDWVFDTAPPAAPSGVAAALQSGGDVQVTWAPNAESDLAGYIVYRALNAAGPYVALNGAPLPSPGYRDDTVPPGATAAWYQVSARDISGNESARSSAASVSLAQAAGIWTAEPVYPNPSRRGTSVQIPLVVPAGAGEARIEIVNNIGQRVRRLDLGLLPEGTTIIQWDGRNDGGREVAPGAYTGWLIAASTRTAVRMVRLP